MEFILSENQKQLAIRTARRRLESELFACALLCGVNPEQLEFVVLIALPCLQSSVSY